MPVNHIVLLVTLPVAVVAVAFAADSAPPIEARHVDSAAVERHPLGNSPVPAEKNAVPGGPSGRPAQPVIVVPPAALYVCVVGAGEVRKQTAIEFAPKVGVLCATHPEMGPCQYERNACRRSGGRVYAADGKELTMATEAEYDKKVLRVRLDGR